MRSIPFALATFGTLFLSACADTTDPGSNASQPPIATQRTPIEVPVAADSDRDTATASRSSTTIAAAVPVANAEFIAPPLTADEISAGWISLFDGTSLFGWRPNSETAWRVEDGVIVADGAVKGLLNTSFQIADFEFRCDFLLEDGGNSGVFLRTTAKPTNPAVDCYELNMCDSHAEFPSACLVGRRKVDAPPQVEGDWHSWFVRAEGNRILVRLDDEQVLDFTDESEHQRDAGFIGLQMNEGRIQFRNVLLRPLGTTDLFNGTNLDGWRVVPGSKSEFNVVDDTIHVTNGRGFLETEAIWGDFMLQTQVRTNGDQLNSGIFFRAMTGTEKTPSHGYEYQIHFGFKNDDPTQPVDHGTGAIFRRAPARHVVGHDREWVTTTLIAQGDHMATWVNGYQVVDWTDNRKPNDNPREGKRIAPGHLSLQGHDPTTDLNFRNLRIVALPPAE